jgi:hypothetical protein
VTGFPASLRRTLPRCAAFIKESRMELIRATDANRKSAEAPNSTPSGSRMKRGFSQPAKWNDAIMKVLVTDGLRKGDDVRSPLAQLVGSKGYHARV